MASESQVRLQIEYPQQLSRLHLLLKTFLGWLYVVIPHMIILYIYGILAAVVTIIAFFAILFTGKYPQGLFSFVVGYHRWGTRVTAYAFYFMTDNYPPFSTGGDHALTLEVEYPERLSRVKVLLKVFLGWLYVGIPHGIALFFYSLAVLVVIFISWWSILIFGKFPQGFFGFVVGLLRWNLRVNVYLYLLRDEYPPFSGRP